jgi:hypothetical protein
MMNLEEIGDRAKKNVNARFYLFCADKGIEPNEANKAIWDEARAATGDEMLAAIEVAMPSILEHAMQRARARGVSQKESPGLFNLFGLLS